MITKVKTFFNEVKVELQKASWPWDPKEKGFRKYKELSDSTLVVVVAITAAAAVSGIAPLFNLYEQDFECQPFVGEDAREVNELFENVEQRSLLWACIARSGDTSPSPTRSRFCGRSRSVPRRRC